MQDKTKRALSVSTIASLLITSSVVSADVKAATTTSTETPRLWGADRYETAAKIAQTGWTSSSDYAVIASGEGYADALCAAPLAKMNNAPILLTQNGDLNANTLSELKRLNVKHVFIVGGTGVVTKKVEDKIKDQVADVQRLAGQNRYETSVKVAEKLGTTSKIVLASGEGYADALSAAPVAAIEGMPILLTESKTLSKATADYIKANTGITKTYVIGGTASVSDSTMNSAPGAQRISGSDRYATNAAVINNFASDFDFKKAYFALGNGPTGNEFADALTGSALAAKDKAPLIIVGKELSDSTKELIKTRLTNSTTITVLGGTTNISDDLVQQVKEGVPTTTPAAGGGGGGGTVSSDTYLSQAGTYSDKINGNAYVTGSNIILKGDVTGDLHMNATNTTASSITVGGTVYVDPGAGGEVTLDNVQADKIVIKSGAADTIRLKDVEANTLTIDSTTNVHVKSEGSTTITNTNIQSQAILDASQGTFGNVTVEDTSADKTVELRGTFDKTIVVEGQATLTTAAGAVVPKLELQPTGNQKITLGGTFGIVDVTKPANIEVAASGNITGLVIASAVSSSVQLAGTGTVKNIENNSSTASLNIGTGVTGVENVSAVNTSTIVSSNTAVTNKVISIVDDSSNYLTVNDGSPILSFSLSGAVSYDIYRNDILIKHATTSTSYEDTEFGYGDNEYYVVALGSDGKPLKRTVRVIKNYNVNALDLFINKAVSFVNAIEGTSGKVSITGTTGNWNINIDDSYKDKTVADMYTIVLNKIKTRPLTQTELDTLNSLMDPININGVSLNQYLITKLQTKSHSAAAIAFLSNPTMDNLNNLRTALANYDSYSEFVDVLKDMSLIQGDKLIPIPKVKGMTLTEVLFNTSNSETNAKVLTTGQTYTLSYIKTDLLGLPAGDNSQLTYNNLISTGYTHIGFKFVDSANKQKIYWVSIGD